ncbi:acyl-CoA-like ligand-binding transcription factor [Amycolatopsis vastitatis]|uniref:acyl-CoA-like ligand-binding transcription factor n=1 Tax=Amycolatopsis vastitatis TaxID=1905142 RepID=UPI0023E41DC4|nr:hypothetical protein [Amycolatopsis vastitatis]
MYPVNVPTSESDRPLQGRSLEAVRPRPRLFAAACVPDEWCLADPGAPWQAEMAGLLSRRTGLDPDTALRPGLAAGIALAAFQTGLRRWGDSDGTQTMDELVDQAFAMITPALDFSTGPS